ncbi:PTS transporter subunit EIIC [Spiroplasma alleghenense]|uniref:PTS system, sucrose-specific IIB component n=1 Tax=Spiroplasma alleghenense TaxID=216931 RepID=A0A345Z5A8_9MOLU|nr:PTS transporter subunit EIIC [Spiroplasma alleghenense]AXK51787.1 PTS system, sucrose-specific IIB component [Spiroplasma alleghenense]
MKKLDWNLVAQEIVDNIGGFENIVEMFHCATRLRFVMKDDNLANLENLKKITYVKGYNKQDNQHQLIIGAGTVDKIYKGYQNIAGVSAVGSDLNVAGKTKLWNKEISWQSNCLQITKKGLNSFAAIFVPLIPIFIIGGMSLAFKSLFAQFLDVNNGFLQILDIIGGAILGSLPAFVGYTAAKKWGGNPFIGMSMGMILIAPALLNSYSNGAPVMLGFELGTPQSVIDAEVKNAFDQWLSNNNLTNNGLEPKEIVGYYFTIFSGVANNFFEIKLIGYQAQIIPVLLVLILSVNLEKGLRKITPEAIAIIVVPLVTVLFSTWIAFWLIGPLGQIIGKGLAIGITAVYKYTNYYGIGFGGMIFAGVYPLLVITGLHQGFLPIEAQLLMDSKLQYGHSFSFITPVACVSNIAQGTACLIAIFYIKNKQQKSTAASAVFGAHLGITEPAMFGVNLQIKPLLVAAIAGSACGGYWLGMTHTVANSLGSASWIGLVQFDWTNTEALKYFAANDIPATFSSLAPGIHVTIAMLISMGATAGFSFLLLNTKWGKNALVSFNGDELKVQTQQ